MRDHPIRTFLHRVIANESRSEAFPFLQVPIESQKEIAPAQEFEISFRKHGRAWKEKLFQSEPCGHRPPRILRMQDGERDHDGARPRRHLINKLERQQHQFRRYRRTCRAWEETEEAEIRTDVAT